VSKENVRGCKIASRKGSKYGSETCQKGGRSHCTQAIVHYPRKEWKDRGKSGSHGTVGCHCRRRDRTVCGYHVGKCGCEHEVDSGPEWYRSQDGDDPRDIMICCKSKPKKPWKMRWSMKIYSYYLFHRNLPMGMRTPPISPITRRDSGGNVPPFALAVLS
jgi:hypothetical protein